MLQKRIICLISSGIVVANPIIIAVTNMPISPVFQSSRLGKENIFLILVIMVVACSCPVIHHRNLCHTWDEGEYLPASNLKAFLRSSCREAIASISIWQCRHLSRCDFTKPCSSLVSSPSRKAVIRLSISLQSTVIYPLLHCSPELTGPSVLEANEVHCEDET